MSEAVLISVDLDDTWAYARTKGDSDWAEAPTVLEIASERLLELFDELDIKVTIFVLGRDAATDQGAEIVRRWHESGHEVGNHSFEHRYDLALASSTAIESDIARAEESIAEAIGVVPVGFRCPSFGLSEGLHRILQIRGYEYDASLLPTSLGPVLRWYQQRSTTYGGSASKRIDIFGPASDGRLPLAPFEWRHSGFRLLEVPVTPMPIVRTPAHMSYLHAAAAASPIIARAYVSMFNRLCRLFDKPTSFLIHPPDVLDASDAPRLSYLPGMETSWQRKVDLVRMSLLSLLEGRTAKTHLDFVRYSGLFPTVDWARANRVRNNEVAAS